MIVCHLFLVVCCIVAGFTNCQKNEIRPTVQKCSSPICSCCHDNAKCQTNGFCDGQCKDGYFGGKCITSCPYNCIRCKDPYNPTGDRALWGVANCTLCKDGFYSTRDLFQCQSHCPFGCETCNSNTECSACTDGYYKNKENTCRSCKAHCSLCSNKEECLKCDEGYYGIDCLPCANGCVDGLCHNQTGECNCKPGFDGTMCDVCSNGYFMAKDTCIVCNLRCESCTSIDECTQCLEGYYGQNCSLPCSKYCNGSSCDQLTGACAVGCTSGYSGDKCCLEGPHCQTCSSNELCAVCDDGLTGPSCKQVSRDNGTGIDWTKVALIGLGVLTAVLIAVIIGFIVCRKRDRKAEPLEMDEHDINHVMTPQEPGYYESLRRETTCEPFYTELDV